MIEQDTQSRSDVAPGRASQSAQEASVRSIPPSWRSTTAMNEHETPDQSDDRRGEPASPRIYLADDLFQGDKEVVIRYGDADYRLRRTRTGKLLLTK